MSLFKIVPSAPSSLMVVNTELGSITLSWIAPDTPNGIITHYELQYKRSNGTSVNSLIISDTNTMMHTIEELMPGVMYTIQLRAYTLVGAGTFISQDVITTRKLFSLYNIHVYIYTYICSY